MLDKETVKRRFSGEEAFEFDEAVIRNQNGKIDLEATLKNGGSVIFTPNGHSMHPLIWPQRDYVLVEPFETKKLKRGDVALYRSELYGHLVIHRVWKHKKDGLYMVGDNQTEIEGPLAEEVFFGKMTYLNRKGRLISVKNALYVISVRLWLFLRPFRRRLMRFAEILKNLIKGKR